MLRGDVGGGLERTKTPDRGICERVLLDLRINIQLAADSNHPLHIYGHILHMLSYLMRKVYMLSSINIYSIHIILFFTVIRLERTTCNTT